MTQPLKREKDDMAIKQAYQLAMIHGKENMDPSCLNFENGVAKTMLDKIIDHRVRKRALEQARHDQREDIAAHRLETFNRCLRMTAGVAFNSGTVELTDGRVHEGVAEQARQREQSELEAVQRRQQQLEHSKRMVDAIRAKYSVPNKFGISKLSNFEISNFKLCSRSHTLVLFSSDSYFLISSF
jgi:hypothetical protein